MFLITQALQFMDKTSLNYANLFGYQKALGLHGKQFNYLSASTFPFAILGGTPDGGVVEQEVLIGMPVVYAGYFFGQYPCGWLIGRFPAQKVLAVSILLWGVMVIVLTQCRTYSSAREFVSPRLPETGH